MKNILREAELSDARMTVLETQTCNENAIAFYRRSGFEIIGLTFIRIQTKTLSGMKCE